MIQILILLATIPLGELYHLFHSEELRLKDWFLFSDKKIDIEWIIKDTTEKLAFIIILVLWRSHERVSVFKPVLTAFIFYRIADLLMYYIDFNRTTPIYAVIYFILGLYILLGTVTSYKKMKCKSK